MAGNQFCGNWICTYHHQIVCTLLEGTAAYSLSAERALVAVAPWIGTCCDSLNTASKILCQLALQVKVSDMKAYTDCCQKPCRYSWAACRWCEVWVYCTYPSFSSMVYSRLCNYLLPWTSSGQGLLLFQQLQTCFDGATQRHRQNKSTRKPFLYVYIWTTVHLFTVDLWPSGSATPLHILYWTHLCLPIGVGCRW